MLSFESLGHTSGFLSSHFPIEKNEKLSIHNYVLERNSHIIDSLIDKAINEKHAILTRSEGSDYIYE